MDVIQAIHSSGRQWLLSMDIKDQFPNIQHHRLFQLLDCCQFPPYLVEQIKERLQTPYNYSGRMHPLNIGLYTGSPESNVLSNVYMTPLDCALASNGFKALRYGDNIYVLFQTEAQAREAEATVHGLVTTMTGLPIGKWDVVPLHQAGNILGYQFYEDQGLNLYPSQLSLNKFGNKLSCIFKRWEKGQATPKTYKKLLTTVRGAYQYYQLISSQQWARALEWSVKTHIASTLLHSQQPSQRKVPLLSLLVGTKRQASNRFQLDGQAIDIQSLAGQIQLPRIPTAPNRQAV